MILFLAAIFLASLDASTSFMGSVGGKAAINRSLALADGLRQSIRSFIPPGHILTTSHYVSMYLLDMFLAFCRLLDDSVGAYSHLVTDPLRFCVNFPGRNALEIDDAMCEGECRSR